MAQNAAKRRLNPRLLRELGVSSHAFCVASVSILRYIQPMRIFLDKRTGYWRFEYARNRSITLKTRDYDEAVKKASTLGYKRPECRCCGSDVPPGKSVWCSTKCRNKGGTEIGRYGATRREIFASFENRCAICHQEKDIRVHHIDGMGTTVPTEKRNNAPENLIVLCAVCHGRLHLGERLRFFGTNNYIWVFNRLHDKLNGQ
jgi:hypothetical protein